MSNFRLGFNAKDLKVKIINNTSNNDSCNSYYFKLSDKYYILWVEHQDLEQRENDNYKRYTLNHAINEASLDLPEVYINVFEDAILCTDNALELIDYINFKL